MTPEIKVTDTIPIHLRLMADAMQEESRIIATHFGITPHKGLWQNYRQSLICKSVFIQNDICAIFGLLGGVFGDTARPWIAMTPETEKYPMRVAFSFKSELKKMATMFPVLEDYIDEDNEKAIRFMALMGFKISKNKIQVGEINMVQAERRS